MEDSRHIEERAADWLAMRDSSSWSESDEQDLAAWLRASTANRVAFIRLKAAWREADQLKALGAGAVPSPGEWRISPFSDPLQTTREPTELDDAEPKKKR